MWQRDGQAEEFEGGMGEDWDLSSSIEARGTARGGPVYRSLQCRDAILPLYDGQVREEEEIRGRA
jgi:hypothetical protein